jgi:Sulfotransferase domain
LAASLSMSIMERMGELEAKDLVWIFGTGRSGSTWLAYMLSEPSGVIGEPVWWRENKEYRTKFWNEPLVGQLFGRFHAEVPRRQLNRKGFILSESTRKAWLDSLRHLVLGEAEALFPKVAEGGYLVVKEPNGSIGAPLLMEAMPESRMVLLVRDPRDVAASALDRHRRGGIAHKKRSQNPQSSRVTTANRADNQPNAFIRGQAHRYATNLGQARQAYKDHEGPKVLVRYEELRADTLSVMRHAFSALNISVSEEELLRTVEKHSWENIPREQKGRGKDRRKGTPRSWREDLTPRQVRIVEEITAPLLKQFYGRSEN